MGIGWLLFLAFVGFLVYLLVRPHTDSGTSTRRRSTAEDLLAELVVLGMDSALIHVRALYEFFFDFGDSDSAGAQRDFGATLRRTPLYQDYKHTINKRLFHIDRHRPMPRKRGGGSLVKRDINRTVKLSADEVLELWDQCARKFPTFKRQLNRARRRAIAEAEAAAHSVGVV